MTTNRCCSSYSPFVFLPDRAAVLVVHEIGVAVVDERGSVLNSMSGEL